MLPISPPFPLYLSMTAMPSIASFCAGWQNFILLLLTILLHHPAPGRFLFPPASFLFSGPGQLAKDFSSRLSLPTPTHPPRSTLLEATLDLCFPFFVFPQSAVRCAPFSMILAFPKSHGVVFDGSGSEVSIPRLLSGGTEVRECDRSPSLAVLPPLWSFC